MKFTRKALVSLVIVVLVLLLQGAYAITSACPAETISKVQCWGPEGVRFLGMNIHKTYLKEQSFTFLFVLLAFFLITVIFKKVKPEKSKEEAINLGIFLFSIAYLLISLLIFFTRFRVMY